MNTVDAKTLLVFVNDLTFDFISRHKRGKVKMEEVERTDLNLATSNAFLHADIVIFTHGAVSVVLKNKFT